MARFANIDMHVRATSIATSSFSCSQNRFQRHRIRVLELVLSVLPVKNGVSLTVCCTCVKILFFIANMSASIGHESPIRLSSSRVYDSSRHTTHKSGTKNTRIQTPVKTLIIPNAPFHFGIMTGNDQQKGVRYTTSEFRNTKSPLRQYQKDDLQLSYYCDARY